MGVRTRLQAVVDRLRGGTAPPDGERSHRNPIRTDGGERRDRAESADEEAGNESDEKDANGPDETGVNGTDEGDADGGTETDADQTAEEDANAGTAVDTSNVEVTETGEAEPAEPKWDRIDPNDIPEFEIRADQPAGTGGSTDGVSADEGADDPAADDQGTTPANARTDDPTAGRPNTARSPGQSRIKQGGTEGYIVALELCARLPEDVRLPEEAADLVPAAVEAELEEDIRAFAAAEFETTAPSVETLSFDEVDDEIWMRLRLGISPAAFADLDPDEIRTHALQQLEGLF